MKKAVASILLILSFLEGLIIYINNNIADGVQQQLRSVAMPESTELIASVSIAGKIYGCGNGMQYTGALLLKSEGTIEAIETFYHGSVSPKCQVHLYNNEESVALRERLSFAARNHTDEYIILSLTLDVESGDFANSVFMEILNCDFRAH